MPTINYTPMEKEYFANSTINALEKANADLAKENADLKRYLKFTIAWIILITILMITYIIYAQPKVQRYNDLCNVVNSISKVFSGIPDSDWEEIDNEMSEISDAFDDMEYNLNKLDKIISDPFNYDDNTVSARNTESRLNHDVEPYTTSYGYDYADDFNDNDVTYSYEESYKIDENGNIYDYNSETNHSYSEYD